MSLSNPRIIYGVHQITPYNRTTGLPYGTALVLANSSIAFQGELNELFGGSSRFPWAVEESTITTDITIGVKSLENWMWEIFMGKAPTHTTTPSANGAVSTLTNKKGTSVVDASTGIASVGLESGEQAELKFSKYVVVAVTATTVDVYAYTNVDFARGTAKEYQDDLLKITASPLTIPDTGGTVSLSDFGIEFTGGSGTVAMTADDTATFEVHPAFNETLEVSVGGSSDVFPEFGMIMVAQKRGNEELFEVDAYRVKGVGLPIGLAEKAFGESEITAKAFYDATENAVAKFRWAQPS